MEEIELRNDLRILTPDETEPVKVGIVIPTLNQFQKALMAIWTISTAHDYKIYVQPNWIFRWPLAKAWNNGIDEALADNCTHILVINDDIEFSPHTIDHLVYQLRTDKRLGMATACNVRDSKTPEETRVLEPQPVSTAPHPDFSCFMITPRTFRIVGRFDENFVPAYFEDNDYHYRMKLLGLEAISSTGAPVYHYGSSTQNGDPSAPVVPGHQFEKCRGYYTEKWGGAPGHETFTVPYNDTGYSVKEWRTHE